MKIFAQCLFAIASLFATSAESKADIIIGYDFSGDKQAWTVSSIDGAGEFRFENLDELHWTPTGGSAGSGGLLFTEKAAWNWTEAFTAPSALVQGLADLDRPLLSYDTAANFNGASHSLILRGGASDTLIYTLSDPLGSAWTFQHYSYDLKSSGLEWQYWVGGGVVPHADALVILNSLSGVYIKADPSGGSLIGQAVLDNVNVVTAVPEPSSCILMTLAGVMGFGYRTLKRRRGGQ